MIERERFAVQREREQRVGVGGVRGFTSALAYGAPASCIERTTADDPSSAPASASRSRTGTPRHAAFALQPSTQEIGSVAARSGSDRRSSSESDKWRRHGSVDHEPVRRDP